MGYPYDAYGQHPQEPDPGVAQPIPYPAQYPYGQFSQQPGYYPPPPPPRRSKAPIYLAIAVVAVVVIAAAVAIPLFLFSRASDTPPAASATELIVTEGDFAGYGGSFDTGVEIAEDEEGGLDVSPAACTYLASFVRPDGVEIADANWNTGDGGLPRAMVLVEKWSDSRLADQAEVITESCGSFSSTDSDDVTIETTAEVFDIDGAVSAATGSEFSFDGGSSTDRWYEAVVRGTTIRVGFSFTEDQGWAEADERAAVDLLNKQIDKVRDAD